MDPLKEFELQRYISLLDTLRASAASEFELKEPFPNAAFESFIKRTGRMLDAFHALNVAIRKDRAPSEGEAELLRFTADERLQLCTRISHLFQGVCVAAITEPSLIPLQY